MTGVRAYRFADGLVVDRGGAAPLLLLDEPGAALDAAGLETVEAVIARARARGTVILATNDPRERRFATHELALT